jgi:cysteine desulfurase
MKRIYLDYNASTPIDPSVLAAMKPYLEGEFGNPSSGHWASRRAVAGLGRARHQVAGLLRCRPDEVIFTSGGSEANNLAIKGTFYALRQRGDHVITSTVEHPAILGPCRFLERLGAIVTYVPVDGTGRVDPDDVRRAITQRTVLISIMHANNEVGTIQPIEEIGRIARDHAILFHSDAAQSAGKILVDVNSLNVDMLSLAGHKFYGPKGVGALYLRRGIALESLIHGAGHEDGRRAGTESALLTAGLGAAAAFASDLKPMAGVKILRERFWETLQRRFGDRVILNGPVEGRLPNTLNVSFKGRVGAELLERLDGIAASTGSACHAGLVEVSPVLQAMGVPPETAMGAVRFSFGRATTQEEVDAAADQLGNLLSGGF